MFCSNCGKKLDSETNFCPNCGAKTNNNTENKVNDESKLNTSSQTKPFFGRDYTNKEIGGNLWINGDAVIGHIFFSEIGIRFRTHVATNVINKVMAFKFDSVNLNQTTVEIRYSDMESIELVNYYLVAPTGLQITTKDKNVYRFVVQRRKDIKEFLEYKMAN